MNYISVDGTLHLHDAKVITLKNRGLKHGYGLFETMLFRKNEIKNISLHLARMRASALALDINIEQTDEILTQWIFELINKIGILKSAVCRLSATMSEGAICEEATATITITVSPLNENTEYENWKLKIAQWHKHTDDPLSRHKTTSYLGNILALKQAKKQGFDEAIFFDEFENLAEGTRTNVFIIYENKVLTPPLSAPILPGITRGLLVAKKSFNNMPIIEEEISKETFLSAESIFLTNSIGGIIKAKL